MSQPASPSLLKRQVSSFVNDHTDTFARDGRYKDNGHAEIATERDLAIIAGVVALQKVHSSTMVVVDLCGDPCRLAGRVHHIQNRRYECRLVDVGNPRKLRDDIDVKQSRHKPGRGMDWKLLAPREVPILSLADWYLTQSDLVDIFWPRGGIIVTRRYQNLSPDSVPGESHVKFSDGRYTVTTSKGSVYTHGLHHWHDDGFLVHGNRRVFYKVVCSFKHELVMIYLTPTTNAPGHLLVSAAISPPPPGGRMTADSIFLDRQGVCVEVSRSIVQRVWGACGDDLESVEKMAGILGKDVPLEYLVDAVEWYNLHHAPPSGAYRNWWIRTVLPRITRKGSWFPRKLVYPLLAFVSHAVYTGPYPELVELEDRAGRGREGAGDDDNTSGGIPGGSTTSAKPPGTIRKNERKSKSHDKSLSGQDIRTNPGRPPSDGESGKSSNGKPKRPKPTAKKGGASQKGLAKLRADAQVKVPKGDQNPNGEELSAVPESGEERPLDSIVPEDRSNGNPSEHQSSGGLDQGESRTSDLVSGDSGGSPPVSIQGTECAAARTKDDAATWTQVVRRGRGKTRQERNKRSPRATVLSLSPGDSAANRRGGRGSGKSSASSSSQSRV